MANRTTPGRIQDWLRGAAADPALELGGRALTYGQLAEATSMIEFAPDGPVDVSDPDPVVTLTRLYAAIGQGRPAIVADPARPPAALDDPPAGTFLIAVTSGSTGRPRPVARTGASWADSFEPLAEITGLDATDTVALTGPLHATLHLFGAMHTLWLGARLTDSPATASAVHCVPTVFMSLLDSLPPHGPLRTAIVAGASLPPAAAEAATARGIRVIEYYGATELSFVGVRRAPLPMRAFPGVELRVRDGVLWSRSPYAATGYLGVDGPFHTDSEGFATVGDLATLTGDGVLTIRGRSDAAITTGGTTILAEDVEAFLCSLPGVLAAAVVGRPHRRFGQVVAAVLRLSSGTDLTRVRTLARHGLGAAALPRLWYTADALPTTSSGKLARADIARAVADGTLTEAVPVRSDRI